MNIYKEDEWFDKFYPKEFGDWREGFNMKARIENPTATGCTWMDYKVAGYLTAVNENGMMILRPWSEDVGIIEHLFISCGESSNEEEVDWFIQPYFQFKDQHYYASIKLTKEESNLDLYKVYISGNDDSSYTKHFIGLSYAGKELQYLRENGISDIRERDYFFTN